VGIFDFFSRRREREGALERAEQDAGATLGSFASPEGQPVVGQPVSDGGGAQVGGLDLSNLGSMIQTAIDQGNVMIEQGPSQAIDMRGTGLREEIFEIMRQHGIDPESGTAGNVNAADYGEMQQQILDALSRHGLDFGAGGIQIQADEGDRT
jgi:hypothetical protein